MADSLPDRALNFVVPLVFAGLIDLRDLDASSR